MLHSWQAFYQLEVCLLPMSGLPVSRWRGLCKYEDRRLAVKLTGLTVCEIKTAETGMSWDVLLLRILRGLSDLVFKVCFREGSPRILAASGTSDTIADSKTCVSQAVGRSAVVWLSVDVIVLCVSLVMSVCSSGNSPAEKRMYSHIC